jgi:hypothetical protein
VMNPHKIKILIRANAFQEYVSRNHALQLNISTSAFAIAFQEYASRNFAPQLNISTSKFAIALISVQA